jgi:hypothetical protein
MASGRQTEDQDIPNLCTDLESVNDDWDRISGQPSRPCGEARPRLKAGQMTATTNCRNVKKVLAMRVSSTDDCVDDTHSTASMCQNVADSN